MTPELSEFIHKQDKEVQQLLNEYYELYLEHYAYKNETKASNDVLAFCKRIQSNPNRDIETELDNEINKMNGDGFNINGLGSGLKKSRKSKKARKSNKSRKSKKSRKYKKK